MSNTKEILGVKMRIKRWCCALLILSLLIPFVCADVKFKVDANPIIDRINITDQARFELTITNLDAVQHEYRITSPSFPIWDIMSDPS